jgi:hypothetical protein
MEHGLIKVVAVVPFCKEVLSRQRPEPGAAKPNRMQSAPGPTAVTTDAALSSQAAVRIHALVRTLITMLCVTASWEAFVPGLFVGRGQRTYPKEYRAVLESPKEQTL